ncbi:MAG: helix-turn-helix domain-containing protein [Firmicutes bacterium]|nr:helix-turn-helix domain-containing protein [Bacillota bacterium]
MNLAIKIQQVRKSSGLSQGKFADKLYVTRQAVSRWETGETTPTIDTLKSMFQFFNVNPSLFFEVSPICQSCSMPLSTPEDMGQNPDKSINLDYCKYCLKEGRFDDSWTMDSLIDFEIGLLKESGEAFDENKVRAELKQKFPTLKRWKKQAAIDRAALFMAKRAVNGECMRDDAFCTISLIDLDGYPASSTITPARSDGIRHIWFGTSLDSNKVKRIKKRSKASVCFNDNDTNISLVGDIEILTDLETKKEVLYKEITKMEIFKDGINDPNLCVLKFTTKRFDIWFGDTNEWEKGKL